MTQHIKFTSSRKDDFRYCPDKLVSTFYQFSQYKNDTGSYNSRKIYFDEYCKILKIFEKQFIGDDIKKFMLKDVTKYKIYPVPI